MSEIMTQSPFLNVAIVEMKQTLLWKGFLSIIFATASSGTLRQWIKLEKGQSGAQMFSLS